MSERPPARVGLISLGAGLAAAGVGAALGVAAERLVAGRPIVPPFGADADDPEPYGEVRGTPVPVTADDGTALHVEIDEPDGDPEHPVTLVFSHGYALSMDSWHFQRQALRGRYRMVFWDQRGHGRSATGPAGSGTIDQLGADLDQVIAAVAPDGPLVLIGHSMGGMTVMSLAERRPELFAERVLGVALVATSAGGLADIDFGASHVGRLVNRLAPGTLALLAKGPFVPLVDAGRRIGSDLEAVLVRRYSYASPVTPELVAFTARMIAETRLVVLADFLPSFGVHDKRAALAALDGLEVLVLVGDTDLLIPTGHSDDIVDVIPGAEHVVVADAGHLVMLEHPDVVTGHLADLVLRATRAHPVRRRRRPRVRQTVRSLRPRRAHRPDDGAA